MALRDLLKQYEGSGNSGFEEKKVPWFSLKDDGDTAMVRFLITDEMDMMNYVKEVHKVKLGDYDNFVLCLKDDCEFCKRGNKPSLRMFVPLYNIDKGELQMWSRGFNDIQELVNNLDEYGNLNNRPYKIKRNGKKGSTKTTYSYFPKEKEKWDKFEEYKAQIPKIVGRNFRYVLELTPEQQLQAIETGRVEWKKSDNDSDSSRDTGEEVF